ncbi:MAG: hypothetical protein LBT51_00955 [Fusobacteriaceae bacterium]|nr:hypothetical protein [Fusobacteriaceae bacterium]
MAKQEKDVLLLRISKRLMLGADFTDDLGLERGKFGIVIYFYNYFRFTGLSIYEDFANELLNELQDSIKEYKFDFRKTICGIGLGFEYLIQNGFIDIEDKMMREFDLQIMNYTNYKSESMDVGLKGAAYYALSRFFADDCLLTIDYVTNLQKSLFHLSSPDKEILRLAGQLLDITNHKRVECPPILTLFLNNIIYDEYSFEHSVNLGIKDGLAGIGLKIMCERHEN